MALASARAASAATSKTIDLKQLEAFYGKAAPAPALALRRRSADAGRQGLRSRADAARTASPSRRARTAGGHALLMINPHTSFYFRPEVHMVSEEGLNAYGAVTWGQFFIYQGFNDAPRLDAHLGRRRRHRRIPGNGASSATASSSTSTATASAPLRAVTSRCRTRPRTAWPAAASPPTSRHHGPVVRAAGRQVGGGAHDGRPDARARAVLRPHQGAQLRRAS